MKLEDFIIAIKICGAFITGAVPPWVSSLAQWVNSDGMPPKIAWLGVVIPLSLAGGTAGVTLFLSQSWNSYKQNGNGNGNGTKIISPPIPVVEQQKV